MTDQLVVLPRNKTSIVLFGLGCILDVIVAIAFDGTFGTAAGSALGSGYIHVSPWYFLGIAILCMLVQSAVIIFGVDNYEQGGKMESDVIVGAIFFVVPILYFLTFLFTEYLFTRKIVNMEFANGATVVLNFMFVWTSAMTLFMQGFIEEAHCRSRG